MSNLLEVDVLLRSEPWGARFLNVFSRWTYLPHRPYLCLLLDLSVGLIILKEIFWSLTLSRFNDENRRDENA